jgi:hypothetical protein
MNDIPNHTDPPKCIRMVVLPALKDNVVENSMIQFLYSFHHIYKSLN